MQPSVPALEWGFPFLGMLASIARFPHAGAAFLAPAHRFRRIARTATVVRSAVLPANASGAPKPLGNPPRSIGLMPPAPWDSRMGR